MTFNKWIEIFISEKGIDLNHYLEVEGPSGMNVMPVSIVIDAMKGTSADEQAAIKNTFVKIDFANGDVMDFIKHLAGALAV